MRVSSQNVQKHMSVAKPEFLEGWVVVQIKITSARGYAYLLVQKNLSLTKSQRTAKICLLQQGFVISRFFCIIIFSYYNWVGRKLFVITRSSLNSLTVDEIGC